MIRTRLPTAALAALLLASTSAAAQTAPTPARPAASLLFMTDFGLRDDSVAICKGVMWSLAPGLHVVDVTHDVEPYSILDGARFLAGVAPHYPPGTVVVAVIDPGVGSERRALVAKTKNGQYFVLPDNGLLTFVERTEGIEEVRVITNAAWHHKPAVSSTFHGRDIFAPVGARIARGDDWTEVGEPTDRWVRLDIPAPRAVGTTLHGLVLGIEHPYGNLVTDVSSALVQQAGLHEGSLLRVRITPKKGAARELKLRFAKTFSDVLPAAPLAYIDSRGRLAFAINVGNFAKKYGVTPLSKLEVIAISRPPVRLRPKL